MIDTIDPRCARQCALAQVKGPAYFVPLDRREDHILVTGGEQPYAIILGGKWAGEGFALDRAESWHGAAIEGIEVRANFASAFSPSTDGKRGLALVVANGQVAIFAKIKDHGGFGQMIMAGLDRKLDHSHTEERLGFSDWKIILKQGNHDALLAEVSAL